MHGPSTYDINGVRRINNNLTGSILLAFYNTSYLNNYIDYLNTRNKIQCIRNIYVIPFILVDGNGYHERTIENGVQDFTYYEIDESDTAYLKNYLIEVVNSFTNLTIKNNKCFVYPYNYLMASNNIGNTIIYKYEDFQTEYHPEVLDKPYFTLTVEMAIAIGGSIRLVPRNYKKKTYNCDESLPLAKFPTCSWSGDAYTNWLTQNAVNIGTSITEIVGGTLLSFASGGTGAVAGTGIALSGATKTANLIGDFREARLKPSITGGNNCGDVNYSNKHNTFKLYKMRVKDEYIKIIDDYFSKYGYKINLVKIPQFTSRVTWNYIETDNCNVIGDIPQNDLLIIRKMFDNGVTMWHDASKMYDYTQSNNIVS